MNCNPTGSPSESPHGSETPAIPAMFAGSVQASERYIATGSAVRAPNLNATVGDVGATRASMPEPKTSSKSRLISVRTFCALR